MTMRAQGEQEPSFADLLRALWRSRLSIIIGALAGLIIGLCVMAVTVPHYNASMIISPTTRTGTPDISALFPDNASFAMEYVVKSFGSGDSSDFMRFEHTLREQSVAAALMADPLIRSGIAQDRALRFEGEQRAEDAAALSAYLQDHVRIEPVGATPLRRVYYSHPDPEFAVYFLKTLYARADGIIQKDVRAKADHRVEWLAGALSRAANPEHRRTLTTLLMDQEQIRMILALDEPFAAKIAEPPSVSSRPSWPRAVIVIPVCILCGIFLMLGVSGLRRSLS